jgi:hypothetical protein
MDSVRKILEWIIFFVCSTCNSKWVNLLDWSRVNAANDYLFHIKTANHFIALWSRVKLRKSSIR